MKPTPAPASPAPTPNRAAIAAHIKDILGLLGENQEREGMKDTPDRYAAAMKFLTSGYRKSIKKIVNDALFTADSSDIVIVRDIEFFSMCEHHLLPFWGKAHVAYIPNGKIIGLSKIPRIVDVYARRFQVQERLTNQVAQAMIDVLQPHGAAVIVEAYHLCMMMRGVEKQHSYTVTSSVHGAFKTDTNTRNELLQLLGSLGNHGLWR